MPCPRCGSNRTSRVMRKGTNIEDQWCDDCGWHGTGIRGLPPPPEEPKPKAPRKPRAKKKPAEPVPVPQVEEPVTDAPPREDEPCSYLQW